MVKRWSELKSSKAEQSWVQNNHSMIFTKVWRPLRCTAQRLQHKITPQQGSNCLQVSSGAAETTKHCGERFALLLPHCANSAVDELIRQIWEHIIQSRDHVITVLSNQVLTYVGPLCRSCTAGTRTCKTITTSVTAADAGSTSFILAVRHSVKGAHLCDPSALLLHHRNSRRLEQLPWTHCCSLDALRCL